MGRRPKLCNDFTAITRNRKGIKPRDGVEIEGTTPWPGKGDTCKQQVKRPNGSAWLCTRDEGHPGDHVAGGFRMVLARWPNPEWEKSRKAA
jgi:hypothetical protein